MIRDCSLPFYPDQYGKFTMKIAFLTIWAHLVTPMGDPKTPLDNFSVMCRCKMLLATSLSPYYEYIYTFSHARYDLLAVLAILTILTPFGPLVCDPMTPLYHAMT